jgi:DNA-binding transcriptional regulator LsrR (DeoR family)
MPTPGENPVPDLPHVETVPTPPGSIVVVRISPEDAEGTFALAEELHRQTGLPIVMVTPGADLAVTTPPDAAAAPAGPAART